MIEITKKQNCSGCHACSSICHKQCITMTEDNEGFLYPQIDKKKCVNCGLCEKVCPIINVPKELDNTIVAYACKNKNDSDRSASSSGGIFSLMCRYAISKRGVVFGAAFDENFSVSHMYAETLEECEKFRGSKYVQSRIGDSHIKAKQFLESGRVVLFSGTPCQIAGLEAFLIKKYENLIMIDIACHGVPSPSIYKKYVDSLEEKNKSKIASISFRDKSTGWSKYSFRVDFENGDKVKEFGYNNVYMKGFLSDIYLRPSCYECKFKKPVTSADITLADYWGIQKIHPDFDDDRGASLALVNTRRGQDIIKNISSNMDIIETDLEYAINCNPCIVRPVKYNSKRDKFFNEFHKNNIEKTICKYTKVELSKKIYRKTRGILIRVKNKIFK
ncbi:Coenzyme F420 hydrogenase/dehydrogenase, beta subunit C-terminal domain [Clostridium butyricum]|uniref:Coenzyme F420 hydrogenase/dehydrogenase, beta subunit C-terminal domain n=1 Tax=Clostridium butyricum TaxID=1492 RepID=UPI003D34D1CF